MVQPSSASSCRCRLDHGRRPEVRRHQELHHARQTTDIFWKALWNTVKNTLYSVPPDIVIALVLAVCCSADAGHAALSARLFCAGGYLGGDGRHRLALALPPRGIITGSSATSDSTRSVAVDPDLVLPSIAAMSVWKHVGFIMLILLAGCNPSRTRSRKRPASMALGRVCVFLLHHPSSAAAGPGALYDPDHHRRVSNVRRCLRDDGGGPFYSSTTLVYYIYQRAFEQYQMGLRRDHRLRALFDHPGRDPDPTSGAEGG